jgi:hypothetical protein
MSSYSRVLNLNIINILLFHKSDTETEMGLRELAELPSLNGEGRSAACTHQSLR